MEESLYCIMCNKEIARDEGHYVMPHGPVCMDCHDKYIKAHIHLTIPS
jgi:phage FluMu protein Com